MKSTWHSIKRTSRIFCGKSNNPEARIQKDQEDKLYDRKWRARRHAYITSHPWCEDCLAQGIYEPATEVHHVIAHRGNHEIFVRSPLMALCIPCHKHRTYKRSEKDGPGKFPEMNAPHPALPVYLVCGAPASGKTSFVQSKAKAGDIVFDLDVIVSEVSREPLYYPVTPMEN